jgi:hypothetical protein
MNSDFCVALCRTTSHDQIKTNPICVSPVALCRKNQCLCKHTFDNSKNRFLLVEKLALVVKSFSFPEIAREAFSSDS